jgi:hypothetical protein
VAPFRRVAPFHGCARAARLSDCKLPPLALLALLALALLHVLALALLAVVCTGCWLCFSALACNQDQLGTRSIIL